MGSAFQQVPPRGSPPRPSSHAPEKRQRRERQASSLQMWSIIEEEPSTADEVPSAVPDLADASASEASNHSNNTPPMLANFIGATCSASAWFTSCFPCAVVDISDEHDDTMIDRLSPEHAMNTMYHGPTFSSFVSDGEESALRETDDPNVMVLHMNPRQMAETIEEDEEYYDDMDNASHEAIPQEYEQIVAVPPPAEPRVQTKVIPAVAAKMTPKKKFNVKKIFGKKSKLV